MTILGNNSAVPAFNRHPTSQVVSHDGTNYLVDCGEGTQIQMIKYKIRRGKITHIFISHLHGDHYFGLVGLINTFSLLSHTQEMHVYAPAPLQQSKYPASEPVTALSVMDLFLKKKKAKENS